MHSVRSAAQKQRQSTHPSAATSHRVKSESTNMRLAWSRCWKLDQMQSSTEAIRKLEINFVSCRWAESTAWNMRSCQLGPYIPILYIVLYIVLFLSHFDFIQFFARHSSTACNIRSDQFFASHESTHTHISAVWQIIRDNKHWSIQSAFEDGLFKIFSENIQWEARKSFSRKWTKKKNKRTLAATHTVRAHKAKNRKRETHLQC